MLRVSTVATCPIIGCGCVDHGGELPPMQSMPKPAEEGMPKPAEEGMPKPAEEGMVAGVSISEYPPLGATAGKFMGTSTGKFMGNPSSTLTTSSECADTPASKRKLPSKKLTATSAEFCLGGAYDGVPEDDMPVFTAAGYTAAGYTSAEYTFVEDASGQCEVDLVLPMPPRALAVWYDMQFDLCMYCKAGENFELDSQGEWIRAFCKQCVTTRIAPKMNYRCPCGQPVYVNGLAQPAPLCSTCHQMSAHN
jgi:hypothetical protein